MSKTSGLTRGDRNRNVRLEARRGLVPAWHAIVAVDLGEDTQMLAVVDHDSRVLARQKLTDTKAHQLGEALGWAVRQAAGHGFAGVTVGCEPTGSRWMHLQQLAGDAGLVFVCVQPLATARARELDDYTCDKSDYRDTRLIGRLVGRLDCYVPEQPPQEWAVLRHQGRRREKLVGRVQACQLEIRDLLGLGWPVVLDAAARPFESTNWLAAVAVVLDRCDGRPERLTRMGRSRFEAAVRRELPRWGGRKIHRPIVHAVYAAVSDTGGAVRNQRPAALQRAGEVLDDLREAKSKLVALETRMVDQLHTLGLAEPVATITGLSPAIAAQILAETGDPTRFASGRAVVKHAGINPAENTSGAHRGQARITKRGRPGLRVAAYRAAWGLRKHNPVAAARYHYLTTRETDRLTHNQAMVAIAAATLRWIYTVATTGRAWNPAIAAGQLNHTQPLPTAA